MSFFWPPSRSGAQWFSVGLTSSFPDLGLVDGDLAQVRPCNKGFKSGCKVFQVPQADSTQRTEIFIDPNEEAILSDQVLVFQYRGKFHAVDHSCPHSSFPLSKAIPFDIEDFGVVLSAGLQCPKHGWSFDLFTGMSDRGNYKLEVWEVQLREAKTDKADIVEKKDSDGLDTKVQEVWVRKKQRMG